jgi:excisionase family DNA binding protein
MTISKPSARLQRRLVTLADAAEYVGVSVKTVRRWIACGDLTGYRAGRRILRVDLNEVDVMLRPTNSWASERV